MAFSTFAKRSSLLLGLLAACTATPQTPALSTSPTLLASITHEGTVECFSVEFMNAQAKSPRCELSALEVSGNRIFFGSDKAIPGKGHSSLLYYEASPQALAGQPTAFIDSETVRETHKFEAFAKLHGTTILLATTGFDRIKENAEWDGYNTLLAWDAQSPQTVQRLNPSTRDGVTSSLAMRELFKQALITEIFPKGPNYFKVEAMAVLPNSRILFGLRETGHRYQEFNYHRTILAGTLAGEFPHLRIEGPLTTAFDFEPTKALGINLPVGISSMAYDVKRQGLWILTSYELQPTDDGVGGYLWFLSMTQFETGQGMPKLIRTPEGEPLHFAHKSEGLTILDNGNLLVVHDDDRVQGRKEITDPSTQFYRELHQSFYSVVTIH